MNSRLVLKDKELLSSRTIACRDVDRVQVLDCDFPDCAIPSGCSVSARAAPNRAYLHAPTIDVQRRWARSGMGGRG